MTTPPSIQPWLFNTDDAPNGWGELKPREQRFLISYVGHGNAARAAREAGYAKKAGKQIGAELLTRHDLLAVLHQMSHKLGCSLENKIVRQEQLAAAMAGIALDEKRKPSDRVSAARTAIAADALLAGLRGQLKVRTPMQAENSASPTLGGEFEYGPREVERLRAQWKVVNGRESSPPLLEIQP